MVTDNLSERAEQLARIIADSGTSSNRLPNVIMDRYKAGETVEELAEDYGIDEEQIEWGIRIAHLLDSATLARGLALEQAAQAACPECGVQAKYWHPANDEGFHRHIAGHQTDALCHALAIRSLAPDAAQALASYKADIAMEATISDVECLLDVIAKEDDDKLTTEAQRLKKALNAAVERQMAEIERRARLDEHSRTCWKKCASGEYPCLRRQQLEADLAESHPQGITDIRQEIYSQPAPCGNCGHPIFTHGRNGCTRYMKSTGGKCGCLGGEVRPAPAKEKL